MEGNSNICEHLVIAGYGIDGCYAEYMLIPERTVVDLVKVPDNIKPEWAAITGCGFGTAWNALTMKSSLKPGDTLIVLGTGGMGLSAVAIASAMGIKVIGIDINEGAVERAKTLPESRYEVERIAVLARFYGGLILNSLGKTIPSSMKNSFHITMREPLGVVGIITPWNFPFLIPGWKIVPAIATGNTVVFKPATNTPTVAYELVKAFYDAGLPKGVLNFVTGSG
ncbi:hypothetical protein DMP16_10735, partial [Sulfolobus sp. B1]